MCVYSISMTKHISSTAFYIVTWGGGLQPQKPPVDLPLGIHYSHKKTDCSGLIWHFVQPCYLLWSQLMCETTAVYYTLSHKYKINIINIIPWNLN